MSQIADEETRKKLMYDSSRLQRSDLYFEMLQILRIFSGSIAQSITDLERLAGHVRYCQECGLWKFPWEELKEQDAVKVINFNWNKVVSMQKKAASAALHQIERKNEEIKSLRDGVSSYRILGRG